MKGRNALLPDKPLYSIRRYFVDQFFQQKIKLFPSNSLIIDIGGKKLNKRGLFNLDSYPLNIKYANIDIDTNPDYLGDAKNIPVPNNMFDGAIIAEVLEHVQNPKAIISEAYRIVKPNGIVLITIPFMYHIHGDPHDYARYTDYYLKSIIKEIGFKRVTIKKQGTFYAVLANLIKLYIGEKINAKPFNFLKFKFYSLVCSMLVSFLMYHDNRTSNKLFLNHTLGFELILIR